MANSVLVTGATGNVGMEVVKVLQKAGQPVRAAVREVAKVEGQFGEGVECVQFDFKRPDTFEAAFKDVKRLFLMRPPDISNAQRDILPAIEAAKRAGVEQVVFLSLLGAENNRIVPHYKIEKLLLTSGMAWTFLRASFFMQNLDTTQRQDIKENNDLFVPAGRGKTSFIDGRDIGAVAALALTQDDHANKAYDLTGSEALDYYQVAEIFTEVLGRPIHYSKPSVVRFFWRWWRSRKRPLVFTLVMTILYMTVALGWGDKLSPELGQLLGRPPLTMRQYVEDYKLVWE
jgi:uncharacterized protein YbjT (DUF2867 family)